MNLTNRSGAALHKVVYISVKPQWPALILFKLLHHSLAMRLKFWSQEQKWKEVCLKC